MTTDNTQALSDIKIQLARIEENLKPLGTLPAMVQDVKDTAKEAMQHATNANSRLDELEPVKSTAEDALRKAEDALRRLDTTQEDQKWFKRTFSGVLITSVATALATAVWNFFQLKP